ncbi:MAG TPA: HNH endonuclease signature motif containing protein [Armatimonadota bacterium]|nr:HNH endonuclease signature motif containing protein [Armatimonadota bacterium]
MSRGRGRSGRPWRRAQSQVRATCTTCWLCGQPINMALPPNDRMSFTVDHVIPLDQGGDPTSLANLRPAHRACNSSKGKKLERQPSRRSRVW